MAESVKTVEGWAKRLRYFRFSYGFGGHANDGESLESAFAYETIAQLKETFRILGIQFREFSSEPLTRKIGQIYSSEESAKIPSIIPGTKWIQQPSWTTVAGQKVFVSCGESQINIDVGETYEITEEDVVSAEIVEKMFDLLPLHKIDPPSQGKRFV